MERALEDEIYDAKKFEREEILKILDEVDIGFINYEEDNEAAGKASLIQELKDKIKEKGITDGFKTTS